MLIRRPAQEAVEAFVDPAITTRFWFTKSTGRLEPGTGYTGDANEVAAKVINSTGGFTHVLCGLKALLEHDIELGVVRDSHPEAL